MSERADVRFRTVFLPVAIVTAAAGVLFSVLVSRDGFDPAEPLLTMLFVILFGWICFWFWVSALGAFRVWRARPELDASLPMTNTHTLVEELPPTAVVIPIHNEDVEGVFARIQAMMESVIEAGNGEFEFFVLSDSTLADVWLREEMAWASLRRQLQRPPLYYRRRPNKFRKKSGNIADFCERWGNRYRYMIVLDADSVMEGTTMIELVRRMEHVPQIGILQAPSLPAMRESLYARLQQFAASVYGTPIFAGLSYCFQDHGTFWGHNAILRVSAFMDHCGLPGLPGRPPFGGPILSHDFVEAALMQRAGYGVRLAWDLSGSYEQCPVSLASARARDRRWCQGNLQHLRLMFSPSFNWRSRIHFGIGVLFYATSAFWGLFVLLHFLLSSRSPMRGLALVPGLSGSVVGSGTSLALLGITLAFLFLAKGLAVALVLADSPRAKAHGGALRVVLSAVVEVLVSILTAPILMASQTAALGSVLLGISVDWGAAARDETESPWKDAVHAHGWQSALGAACAVAALLVDRTLFAWLAPLWLGLLVAVPLAAALSSRECGRSLRQRGLLLTPPETGRVAILDRVLEVQESNSTTELDFDARFRRMVVDPWLNTLHIALLEGVGTRSRPRHIMATLVRRALENGSASLSLRDALAVLSDPWAMRTLHAESATEDDDWGTTSESKERTERERSESPFGQVFDEQRIERPGVE